MGTCDLSANRPRIPLALIARLTPVRQLRYRPRNCQSKFLSDAIAGGAFSIHTIKSPSLPQARAIIVTVYREFCD